MKDNFYKSVLHQFIGKKILPGFGKTEFPDNTCYWIEASRATTALNNSTINLMCIK